MSKVLTKLGINYSVKIFLSLFVFIFLFSFTSASSQFGYNYLDNTPTGVSNNTYNNNTYINQTTNLSIGSTILNSAFNSSVLFIDGTGKLAQSDFFKYANGQLNLTSVGGTSPLLLNGNISGTNNICLSNGTNCNVTATNLSGYVPYVNATSNVGLGDYILQAGKGNIHLAPTGGYGSGLGVDKLSDYAFYGVSKWVLGTGWNWYVNTEISKDEAGTGTLSQPVANMYRGPYKGEVCQLQVIVKSLTAGSFTVTYAGHTIGTISSAGTFTYEVPEPTNLTAPFTITPTNDARFVLSAIHLNRYNTGNLFVAGTINAGGLDFTDGQVTFRNADLSIVRSSGIRGWAGEYGDTNTFLIQGQDGSGFLAGGLLNWQNDGTFNALRYTGDGSSLTGVRVNSIFDDWNGNYEAMSFANNLIGIGSITVNNADVFTGSYSYANENFGNYPVFRYNDGSIDYYIYFDSLYGIWIMSTEHLVPYESLSVAPWYSSSQFWGDWNDDTSSGYIPNLVPSFLIDGSGNYNTNGERAVFDESNGISISYGGSSNTYTGRTLYSSIGSEVLGWNNAYLDLTGFNVAYTGDFLQDDANPWSASKWDFDGTVEFTIASQTLIWTAGSATSGTAYPVTPRITTSGYKYKISYDILTFTGTGASVSINGAVLGTSEQGTQSGSVYFIGDGGEIQLTVSDPNNDAYLEMGILTIQEVQTIGKIATDTLYVGDENDWAGWANYPGTQLNGEVIMGAKNAQLKIIPNSPTTGAVWIDMPTTGASGIGNGGAGTNPWIAYTSGDSEWFQDAVKGDINYRNQDGRLSYGLSGSENAIMRFWRVADGIGDYQQYITTDYRTQAFDTTSTINKVCFGCGYNATQVDNFLNGSNNGFNGSLKIGNNTGSINISESGDFKLVGTATQWDDMTMPLVLGKTSGLHIPAFSPFKNGTMAYEFQASDEIYVTQQMSHSYKIGSNIYQHTHISPTSTNTGNVTICIEYTKSDIGGVFPSTTTQCGTTYFNGTASQHILDLDGTIGGFNGLSGVINARVFRNATTIGSAYPNKVFILAYDLHYEKDSLGSNEEFVK